CVARAAVRRQSPNDAEDPRPERPRGVERLRFAVNDRECVLYDIFGIVGVAGELSGEKRGGADVPPHEDAERRAIASSRGGEQFGIARYLEDLITHAAMPPA